MSELVTGFLQVVTPATIVGATLAGAGVGYILVGRVAADPAYTSPTATARSLGFVTIGTAIAVGFVFYGVQTVAAIAEGDFGWPRILSRYLLWCLYSTTLGLGVWLRVAEHLRAKRQVAHDIAKAEIDEHAG